jgi:hypothetical protein
MVRLMKGFLVSSLIKNCSIKFKAGENLSPEDKHPIKTFIDAILTKGQIQKLAQLKNTQPFFGLGSFA